jgi:hypothetical protein
MPAKNRRPEVLQWDNIKNPNPFFGNTNRAIPTAFSFQGEYNKQEALDQ